MRVMTMLLVLLAVMSVAFAQDDASNNRGFLVIGNGEGAMNGVPFGGLPYQDRYQQFLYPWAFPQRPILLKALAFSSNAAGGSGKTTLNVTIKMGEAIGLFPYPIFDLNLIKWKVVYNGPITAELTGQPNDLRFVLMKPFKYDPKAWKPLVIDIEIHDVGGFTGSFRSGISNDTGRVFRSVGDGTIVAEPNVGLLARLEFVPAGKE